MAKARKAVKMADIAEQLQVSTVTVSKALSGQKGVSEELRCKIRETAVRLGYRVPGSDRSGIAKKSYNIGVLLPERYLANSATFYWKLYQKVADCINKEKCFSLFESISEQMQRTGILPRLLLEEKKVDGIIVIGKPGYEYDALLKREAVVPLIFLDFYDREEGADCFISDGFYGTYVLTDYLLKKGHRDIAYVGTLFATESITDRYLGYLKAMLEQGLVPPEDYRIDDRDKESGLRDEYGSFAMPEKMPTAFVCNCDFIASLVIKQLRGLGYRVPEDISVVGFDNYLYPGLCDVEITTYEVDMEEMAKRAISVLLQKLEGQEYKKGIHIVEGRMVEKKSVAEKK